VLWLKPLPSSCCNAVALFHRNEPFKERAGSVSQGIGNVLWLKPLPSSCRNAVALVSSGVEMQQRQQIQLPLQTKAPSRAYTWDILEGENNINIACHHTDQDISGSSSVVACSTCTLLMGWQHPQIFPHAPKDARIHLPVPCLTWLVMPVVLHGYADLAFTASLTLGPNQ
jgi:hypothetical protein